MKNNVNLVGRVGADVEIRSLNSGDKVATFRVATEESWKDRESGEWKNRATWHTVETFVPGIIGYLERNVSKGDLVDIEGMLRYDEYEKDGVKQVRAKISLKGPAHSVRIVKSAKPNGAGKQAEQERSFDEDDHIPF